MFDVLLLTLLSIQCLDYSADIFHYDNSVKVEIIENLMDRKEPQTVYSIYKKLPPLKQSISLGPAVSITAQSAVVVDVGSGEILWQKNPQVVSSIASLTKLMTALVFLGTQPDFSQEIEFSVEDEEGVEGSRLYMKAGEKLTVKDLFYASLVGSANNAARALARSTGLTAEEFIARMNNKAKEMSLLNTVFYDVTGLNPENKSTVLEYTRLANYAFRNSQINEAVNTKEYTFRTLDKEIRHTIRNTNQLISDSELSFIGAKTGYLDEAGYTFVCEAQEDGHEITVTLFGSGSSQERFIETKSLIGWTFGNFRWLP